MTRTVVVLVFFVSGLSLAVSHVSAQSVIPLIVAPARQQITINPGEEAQVSIKFYNQGNSPVSGLVKVADFIVEDDKGTPRLIDTAGQASPRYSASQWVALPFDRMTIAANDKAVVQFSLKVPTSAHAGGRYAAVYFEPVAPFTEPGASGASITPRIVSLLYIRVSGQITENAFISGMFAKSFQEFGPIGVSGQIMNNGDYHIRPRGMFTLTDGFGGLVEQSNLKESNIFPDMATSFLTTLGQKWMVGKYKINLNATYGEKGLAMSKSIDVLVFPWRATIIVLLALFILYIFGKGIYGTFVKRESNLEAELAKERNEIEKLKGQLKDKDS